MNIRRVLFPTDFSPGSDAALELASTLAAESDAKLDIIHVDDMRDINVTLADLGYVPSTDLEDRPAISERLAQIVPPVAGLQYEHHYLKGIPVIEITGFAKREHVDLIVMASHGRTGLWRILMGSVAEGVMRKAACPVLIVKQPSHKDEQDHQYSPTSDAEVRVSHG